MADVEMSEAKATIEESQQWDVGQCEAALAHLERLQEQVPTALSPKVFFVLTLCQLDGLRTTMPSLVAPLIRPNESKAQMYAEIKKAAVQSTDGLKTFRTDWTSEETQQLLERSKESLRKDGDLSKANDVAHYGWSTQ